VSDRVALVTGCGKDRGIGAATALALAGRVGAVAVADVADRGAPNLNEQPADMTATWRGLPGLVEQLTARGVKALAVHGDVGVEEDCRAMVDEVLGAFGRVDVLVNNAAAPQAAEFNDIEDITLAAWQRVIDVNLTGTFLMSRAVVPAMRRGGWGRIVNVSSIAGRSGSPRQSAYSASKAGIIGFTRSVAKDVARDGITVNAVCPGATATSRAQSSARRSASDIPEELARRAAAIPVGRLGTAEDVAELVAFLAGDAASFITGQAYSVDGGVFAG
jgi:3-oxoacyl-[acyl-carrier protein] reductase